MKNTEYLKFGNTSVTLHEAKIIAHLILGLERKEIAVELGITTGTLDTEMRNLFRFLHVPNAVRLAVIAMESGFNSRGQYKRRNIL